MLIAWQEAAKTFSDQATQNNGKDYGSGRGALSKTRANGSIASFMEIPCPLIFLVVRCAVGISVNLRRPAYFPLNFGGRFS